MATSLRCPAPGAEQVCSWFQSLARVEKDIEIRTMQEQSMLNEE